MKLVYIANVRLPTEKAHGLQIIKMCENFAKASKFGENLDVELVVPKRFNRIKEDIFLFYNVKRNFKITKIPCFGLFSANGFLGMIYFLTQTVSFLFVARLHLLFSRFDILYTREQIAGLFYKNFVLEIHSLPKKITFFHKIIWQRANKLVVLTNYIKEIIVKNGVANDKILVEADAVDLNEFDIPISQKEARKKIGLPLNKKIILYAGSLTLFDWKGVDIILQAAKFINNNCMFVLVGGEKLEIEALKNKFDIKDSNNVLFAGQKSHSLIPFYIKAADVLTLPNKAGDVWSEYYTSPLKLFEYMAGRRPIVASNIPSIKEILNVNSALLFEANSAVDLVEKINLILANQDLGKKFADNAYKIVMNFTWKKRAQTIINFINC
ncbi:MAG: glycosyltransferase family 4 protein [Patescibacteria group bacterium]|jgi:glycosyltransferase involved in cell wall biosynthesis|nr:glycosyltransferase family 4 protein [Patescibacteria group bacterium]